VAIFKVIVDLRLIQKVNSGELNRKHNMETQIVQQFTQQSYEMTAAERSFDNMVVGEISTTLATVVLLLVDFYQIPYVLTGILPYVIHLGLSLIPLFGIGILVTYERKQTAKLAYNMARKALILEFTRKD
jgi:hypothetical protein